jgi:hypothetical protein
MTWLTENAFFVIIILACVGMHFFHGHGGHKGHAGQNRDGESAKRPVPDRNE